MFSLKSLNSVTKINVIAVKEFKPATSCVGGHDATTVPKDTWRDRIFKCLLPTPRSCGQGYVFTRVCTLSKGGGLPQCMLAYCHPPAKEAPPAKRLPLPGLHPRGNWLGSDPGPHSRGKLRRIRSRPTPRGKLRGIRSRPTPKREIEGDQIQAHTQGGNCGGSDPGPHPRGKLRRIRFSPPPPPPRSRLRHTVNERAVRILLECILCFLSDSLICWIHWISVPFRKISNDPRQMFEIHITLGGSFRNNKPLRSPGYEV